jgi:hypothetical protein
MLELAFAIALGIVIAGVALAFMKEIAQGCGVIVLVIVAGLVLRFASGVEGALFRRAFFFGFAGRSGEGGALRKRLAMSSIVKPGPSLSFRFVIRGPYERDSYW